MSKVLRTSESTSSLYDIARMSRVKTEKVIGGEASTVTPLPTSTTLSMKIDMILAAIPTKGGVSTATINSMKDEIIACVESEVAKAVEATESRIRAELSREVSSTMGEGMSRKEFSDLFLSGLKEVIPELVRQSGNNSAGYGPRRDRDMESLAKSIQVKP